MAFPTATVTQGSGLTVNLLPNAGQATMSNSFPVTIASDQSAILVTSLASGAITNPASNLNRPGSALSASVTATSASPCVFTWTGNPLVNGQTVFLSGTTAPAGFGLGITYNVVGVSGNTFQLSGTIGGAGLNSTSTGTGLSATLDYSPNQLIASSATSPVVPSFSIATSAGGVIIPRVRLNTNIASGWGGVTLSVNLWSAAPTYSTGDGTAYSVATGSANWLATYLITPLVQFSGGAFGSGTITNANEMALKLASGTSVFWDIQTLGNPNISFYTPVTNQLFTLTPELLN